MRDRILTSFTQDDVKRVLEGRGLSEQKALILDASEGLEALELLFILHILRPDAISSWFACRAGTKRSTATASSTLGP